MRRREIVIAAAAAVYGRRALAQQPARARIGFVVTGEAFPHRPFDEALERLGWIEGRNLTVDRRITGEDPERRKRAAAALVAGRPDAIVAGGVFTGTTVLGGELDGKRLALLHELIPSATHIAVIGRKTGRYIARIAALQDLGRRLGIGISPRYPEDLEEMDAAYGASAAAGDRADHQPEDGKGSRPHGSAIDPRARRRGHRMRRRGFIAGAAALAAIPAAQARQRTIVQRLAIFSPSQSIASMRDQTGNGYSRVLFSELRRLGHVDGANLTTLWFVKEQNTAGLDALAAEVVRSNPDVVLSIGPELAALRAATQAIPIVAVTSDPIALGLIHSLAHPGGNITGVSIDAGLSIWGKRIELLHEMFPSMSRLAYLGPQASATLRSRTPAIRAAAEAARLPFVAALYDLPSSEPAVRQAIATAVRKGADAIMVADTPDTFESRLVITDLIGKARLPAMYAIREFVESGGLMAYEADFGELFRHLAQDIDAILRGAKPGDIPYYQPTKFDLTINVKTAKALGLTIPQSILARADEVIE